MVRVLTDEDFNKHVIRGLRRVLPSLDLVRVVDVEPSAPDPRVLQLATDQHRVLLTHDVGSMPRHIDDRRAEGLPMPGVILIPQERGIGWVIRQLHVFLQFDDPADFDPPLWL